MNSVLLNGSPRGKSSNTRILLEAFQNGFGPEPPQQIYVYREEVEKLVELFTQNDTVIFAFPLYTDMMPGKVKQLIEAADAALWAGKKIGVIVQSGFPEAVQSSYIVKYFERLAEKRQAVFIGAVIKGRVEGIQIMPEKMTARLRENFRRLGEAYRNTGMLDQAIAGELKKPWKMSAPARLGFSLARLTGLTNFYWNKKLKENGAYDERFAAPYEVNTPGRG